MSLAGRPAETDVSAGAWISEATSSSAVGVTSFVPRVFDAYARVLHPAVRYEGTDDVDVTWAEVAAHNGTVAHPLMQWPAVTGGWDFLHEADQSPLWDDAPAEGHLPASVATSLITVLRSHTTTPQDCWFGVWHGFGGIVSAVPTLRIPEREYWLVRGPIELAAANMAPEPSEQSVNLWWPADRSWCVATDIDLLSTYVGGSAACIAELLATPALEVAPASPDDPVDYAADTINPAPPR